ncbi:MAG: hypothetical protein NC347_11940 [Clostridium sp.]|nr:hypothetical protein [Clostridium sp.]
MIKKKYDKEKIVIATILLVVVIGITIILAFLNNSKKINIDFKVPNYYSLANYNYDGDFNKFYFDTYNWYKSIENENGVYLINTSYNDEELLNIWKENNVYKTIPNKTFWEFTASPSYLKQINVNIDPNDLNDASNGVRLYLVPDTLNDVEFETMKAYLEESALYELDKSIIKTNFVENKSIKVVKYSPKETYFTWQSEKGEPITDNSPVIFVCTSENMKYYESESLIATGIDSYIKFGNEEIMKSLSDYDNLKKYNLNFMSSSEIYKEAAKNRLVDSGIEKAFN